MANKNPSAGKPADAQANPGAEAVPDPAIAAKIAELQQLLDEMTALADAERTKRERGDAIVLDLQAENAALSAKLADATRLIAEAAREIEALRAAAKPAAGVTIDDSDAPLFIDAAHVTVMRDGEQHRVAGGVLVDETDLADDEIDELVAMRIIRRAKPHEVEAAELRAGASE